MKKNALFAITLAAFILTGCDFLENLFGGDDPTDRPGIPEMETYIAGLPYVSDELIVEEATPTTFSPLVATAKDANGNNIFADLSHRIDLVLNDALVLAPECDTFASDQYQSLSTAPTLQLVRYWVRIGDIKRYTGGTITEFTDSYTTGTESTEAYSFTETLGLSATASGGGLFVDVEVTVSAEFSATQSFESTFSEETTEETTVSVAPEVGKNVAYAVWQLYEEFRFVNPTPDDEGVYELYTDGSYVFDDPETQFRFVSPTDVIVEQAYIFNQ